MAKNNFTSTGNSKAKNNFLIKVIKDKNEEIKNMSKTHASQVTEMSQKIINLEKMIELQGQNIDNDKCKKNTEIEHLKEMIKDKNHEIKDYVKQVMDLKIQLFQSQIEVKIKSDQISCMEKAFQKVTPNAKDLKNQLNVCGLEIQSNELAMEKAIYILDKKCALSKCLSNTNFTKGDQLQHKLETYINKVESEKKIKSDEINLVKRQACNVIHEHKLLIAKYNELAEENSILKSQLEENNQQE